MTDPSKLDPRVNAFRPDLADVSLQGRVTAKRYVEPKPRQCIQGVVPLLAEPKEDARRVSEIRYGEFLDVFEDRKDGFVWVQNRSDRYVGYLPSPEVLNESIASLSNRIKALHTFVYAEPDLKSPLLDRLTLGSYVSVMRKAGGFLELASGGFVFAGHVLATGDMITPDYVFTAGRMLGAPYLWGGRTPLGIDCSALVQLALEMAGIEAPRDCDQQREAFGQPLEKNWRDVTWRRGDIVFFAPPHAGSAPHVGIMTSHDHLINANATVMQVTVEPLANVVTRGNEIVAKGRP
ncbi:MAG: NlpC/P60 family protein [Alphaproteobacteria bacterium]|nr:NlpC/P60 family protein [Alphaproteobacteria bacterium]